MFVEDPPFNDYRDSTSLEVVLYTDFNTRVSRRAYSGLMSFLVPNRKPNRHNLHIATDNNDPQLIYLFTHAGAHLILEEPLTPNATIFEPIKDRGASFVKRSDIETNKHKQAEVLTYGILSGKIENNWDQVLLDLDVNPFIDDIMEEYLKKALLLRRVLSGNYYNIGTHLWQIEI